jgi:hypothetical protein
MLSKTIAFILLAGMLVGRCAHADQAAIRVESLHHWVLTEQSIDARTGEIVREVNVPGPVFETLEQCSKAQSGRIEHVHESLVHAYECRHDDLEVTI